jgi:hypothetical protein
MSASSRRYFARYRWLTVGLLCVVSAAVFAQTVVTPVAPAVVAVPAVAGRIDAPDGAPELTAEKNVSNTSVAAPAKVPSSVIVEEERVQGRLANARVSVGGRRGYTVVDPNAGRTDRQTDNGGKRVSPSLWELFRF